MKVIRSAYPLDKDICLVGVTLWIFTNGAGGASAGELSLEVGKAFPILAKRHYDWPWPTRPPTKS